MMTVRQTNDLEIEIMPHTKSAAKRHGQSLVRRAKNRAIIKTLKTHTKRVQDAAKAKDLAKLTEEIRIAAKKFDQAAAKGTVHRNLAARKKAQFSKLVKSMTAQ